MATPRSNSSGSKKKSSSTWRSVRMPYHGAVARTLRQAISDDVDGWASATRDPGFQGKWSLDQDEDEMPLTTITDDPEPDLDADMDDAMAPIAGAETAVLGGGKRTTTKESPQEAKATLDAQIQLWRDQGVEKFHPRDLVKALKDALPL